MHFYIIINGECLRIVNKGESNEEKTILSDGGIFGLNSLYNIETYVKSDYVNYTTHIIARNEVSLMKISKESLHNIKFNTVVNYLKQWNTRTEKIRKDIGNKIKIKLIENKIKLSYLSKERLTLINSDKKSSHIQDIINLEVQEIERKKTITTKDIIKNNKYTNAQKDLTYHSNKKIIEKITNKNQKNDIVSKLHFASKSLERSNFHLKSLTTIGNSIQNENEKLLNLTKTFCNTLTKKSSCLNIKQNNSVNKLNLLGQFDSLDSASSNRDYNIRHTTNIEKQEFKKASITQELKLYFSKKFIKNNFTLNKGSVTCSSKTNHKIFNSGDFKIPLVSNNNEKKK